MQLEQATAIIGGSDITNHFVIGGMTAYAIKYLQRAGWCPLTVDMKAVSRFISGAAAAAVAFGITAHGDATAGWVINVPGVAVLLDGLWEWGKQFFFNQFVYDVAVSPRRHEVHYGPDRQHAKQQPPAIVVTDSDFTD